MEDLNDQAAVFGSMVHRLTNAPETVRTLFLYVMAWLMVNDGEASLISVDKRGDETYFIFGFSNGKTLSLRKPVLTNEEEQVLYSEIKAAKLIPAV